MTIASLWFKPEYAYLPDRKTVWGTLNPGEIVTIQSVSTETAPEAQWVTFTRYNTEGAPATLCFPKLSNTYGRALGMMSDMCISLTGYGLTQAALKQPGDIDVMMVIWPGEIRTDPDGSALGIAKVDGGDILHVLEKRTDTDKYIKVRFVDQQTGVTRYGWFDSWAPAPVQIKAGTYYGKLLNLNVTTTTPIPTPTTLEARVAAIEAKLAALKAAL